MKTIFADKVASVAQHNNLGYELRVSGDIPCNEGVLIAVKILNNKSRYNQLELTSGRMSTLKEGDIVEVRERSKQMASILEAISLAERDVPDYIETDYSKMTAKFMRTPGLGDVPFSVVMEPNLVIEYYAQN